MDPDGSFLARGKTNKGDVKLPFTVTAANCGVLSSFLTYYNTNLFNSFLSKNFRRFIDCSYTSPACIRVSRIYPCNRLIDVISDFLQLRLGVSFKKFHKPMCPRTFLCGPCSTTWHLKEKNIF